MALYHSFLVGEEVLLPELRIQYKDYAVWRRDRLKDQLSDIHLAYWRRQLGGELPILELSGDRPRPMIKTFVGDVVNKSIPRKSYEGMVDQARRQYVPLLAGLLAAVDALLYRYTNQEDIIVGSPMAGRDHADLHDQIGYYVNAVPLRSRFSGKDNYSQLLEKTGQVITEAYDHQDYPFDQLVDELGIQRDIRRNPIFDVWVVLQDNETGLMKDRVEASGLKVLPYEYAGTQASRFDLAFNFIELDGDLQANINFNSDIFNRDTIERMASHLVKLMEIAVLDPQRPINEIDFLSSEEKETLLHGFNGSGVRYPAEKTFVDLFLEQAQRTPEEVAVAYGTQNLTYRELDERSGRFARYLKASFGTGPGDLVAMKLERSEWMIVALLGVLRSGAAYVPVDVEFPEERITYMLTDSHCTCLIDEAELKKFMAVEESYAGESPRSLAHPAGLAYVIYTSGSTGQPKGVMILHQSLVDYSFGIIARTNIRECKTFGLVSTIAADLGNTLIYTSLMIGGMIRVFSAKDMMSPERMLCWDLDCIKIVPSHWKALRWEDRSLLPGKCLIFGGERMTEDILFSLKIAKATCNIYNHYGPTETTIGKLIKHIDLRDPALRISLGSPFGNNQIYILNDLQMIAPIGVPGEICIGGDGLARGYLNNPALSDEKFVVNQHTGRRLYKTGDIGKWLPSGEIEFIGRKDHQVKIRGYRVELGEIEKAVCMHDQIGACVVLLSPDSGGGETLVAYLAGKEEVAVDEMRLFLGKKLPAYMLPSKFIRVDQIPLTQNGKIDRQALQALGEQDGEAAPVYVAARNDTEERLVAIWEDVFGAGGKRISIRDNFFSLGGHSLMAIRVVIRVQDQFGVEIDLPDFFNEPTVEALATEIDNVLWLRGS